MTKKTFPTNLVCPECGNVSTIWRVRNRPLFHIKDLYCYNCQMVTKQIETQNLDLLMAAIENKEYSERTDLEKKVYVLVKKGKQI